MLVCLSRFSHSICQISGFNLPLFPSKNAFVDGSKGDSDVGDNVLLVILLW